MNTEAIGRWTQELRSGNRAQATGRLHLVEGGNTGYCCLGVACDLFAEELGLRVAPESWGDNMSVVRYNDDNSALPREVSDYLGFDRGNPFINLPLNDDQLSQAEIDGKMIDATLAELNDDGMTFAQIADVIDYFFKD